MTLILRLENENDVEGISRLHRAAFGQDDEAELVQALRRGGFIRLSLLAQLGDEVIGHVLFSALPIHTTQGVVPALSLAPMAVMPEHQRQGVGSQLVVRGLELCRELGHRIVVVLGHPEFYRRFNFSTELAAPLKSPFTGDPWMALELVPESLKGVSGQVQYPSPFQLDS